MNVRLSGSPRLFAVTVAVALIIALPQTVGAITWSDVTAAEAEASQAANRHAEAERALQEAIDERDALLASIERLEQREAEIAAVAEEEGATIRDRIARMYMTAGAGTSQIAVADAGRFATRVAYLGAISQRDRDLVNQFAVTVVDLEQLRVTAEQRLTETADRLGELEATATERAREAEAARTRLATVRSEWQAYEAAQRAAAEAALREQEQSMAGGGTTTTAGGAPTTTTTMPSWTPSAGVEQWRPLVTEVFNRWGLNQTDCATRNGIQFCVGPQVDNALRIIQCESSGNPTAVNPSSGTSGLFQNHPFYWQDRVNRVRNLHSDKEPNFPADASIFNPEYNIVVGALLVWESKEVLLGRRGGGGIGGVPWPEFNFNVYYNGNPVAYGYSVWGKGPNPWGHWVGCAATRGVNALGDSGPPFTYNSGQGLYDSGWIHPWAQQQSPP